MFVGLAPLYLQYAACSFSYLYLVSFVVEFEDRGLYFIY